MLLGPPLLGALLAAAVRPYRRFVGWTSAVLSLSSIGAAVALWRHVLAGDVLTSGPGEFLRADALSTLLALCVSIVGALAAWLGPGLGADDGYDAAQARRFRIFGNLFTFTMLFAVTSNNVGFMWVAIEATTITSAMLIPLHVTKASVEASWKYILIGSVGIALAFGGTVLGYFDFVNLAGRQEAALNWTVLRASAPAASSGGDPARLRLHPHRLRHEGGPRAHAHVAAGRPLGGAVAPVGHDVRRAARGRALRGDPVEGGGERGGRDGVHGRPLIALGLLSIAIAAFSLVIQRNYKRMLAYSSIEHTGLICVGLALGPLGTFAAMLHLLNHALAKSMMFFLAGRVLHRYGTTEIGRVSGLLKVMPWTGGLFAAGVLAVIGLPPFGLFISEFALFRAGFAAGRPWLMGLVLALLAVAFVSMIGHLNRMLYGAPTAGVPVGERDLWPLVPLGACVAALVVLGVVLPAPLQALLRQIVEIVEQ